MKMADLYWGGASLISVHIDEWDIAWPLCCGNAYKQSGLDYDYVSGSKARRWKPACCRLFGLDRLSLLLTSSRPDLRRLAHLFSDTT